MGRMWDERVWFVVSAGLSAILWYLRDRQILATPGEGQKLRLWSRTAWGAAGAFLVARAIWFFWSGDSPTRVFVPGIGFFLTLVVGAVLGIFFGSFVASIRRTASPLQGLWMGALALLALSVGYSLPVYRGAISQIIQEAGLSGVKISVADITLEAALAAKGKRGEVSGSGGASGSTTQAVPRPTDPTPGVRTLANDFVDHPKPSSDKTKTSRKLDSVIISRDLDYINFTRPEDVKALKVVENDLINFFEPVKLLAECLEEYRGSIQDSQLLLIDISSSMRPLFLMHNEFIAQVKNITDPSVDTALPKKEKYTDLDYSALQEGVHKTIDTAIETLIHSKYIIHPPTQCIHSLYSLTEKQQKYLDAFGPAALERDPGDSVTVYQPYVTMALSSLLVAHGASDEAVSVLAEWLWSYEQLRYYEAHHNQEYKMPEWYQIEVLGRLQVILKDIAGSSNRAFRDVLEHYREVFAGYMESATPPLRVSDLQARCESWEKKYGPGPSWEKKHGPGKASPDDDASDVERALVFILWQTEVDSLRTEINFIPETNDFEALWNLRSRAVAAKKMTVKCLPTFPPATFTPDYNAGLVAESSVVAGLVALAAAERMDALGKSSSDRNVVGDVRKEGREWLSSGWGDLEPIWKRDTDLNRRRPWSERIFGGSQWDPTASLALRVLSRLHEEE
jgi:hypothetical protein